MPLGSPSVGLGEYLTLWTIIIIAIIGILGWIAGATGGAAVVFIVAGAAGAFIVYAILSRAYRYLLHGSLTSGGERGGRDV